MTTTGTATAHQELTDEFNPFLAMAKRFEIASDRLGLDPGLRDVLRTPDRELSVSVPVLMDDKTLKVFTGYRSSTTGCLVPARVESALRRTSTWTRCAPCPLG